jgi:alpha-tubulin suppressor-like RCC1 family protein
VEEVGLGDAVQIEAGGSLTCARRAGGTVSCWGSNAFGGLGQGSVNYGDNPAPLAVRELSDAVRIEVGSWYACALRASGQPVCWGDNTAGQLGDGSGVQRTLPTPVVGLSGITGISAGYSHTCARGSSGQVWCWGQNRDGQLGDGTNVVRYAPRPVLW